MTLFQTDALGLLIFEIYLQKANNKDSEADDDDGWGDDDQFTEEAIKKRREELSNAAKGLAFTDDLEKSAEERLNMIYEMIKVCLPNIFFNEPYGLYLLFIFFLSFS